MVSLHWMIVAFPRHVSDTATATPDDPAQPPNFAAVLDSSRGHPFPFFVAVALFLCLSPGFAPAATGDTINKPVSVWASLIRHPKMGSCPSVKNILVLDSEGKRVAVKYYRDEWPSLSSKLAFEKAVFTKTLKAGSKKEAEVVMFDGQIVVYKFIQGLSFFVTGGEEENELILESVLEGFSEAVACVLPSKKLNKRIALQNLDLIFLCLDEVIDEGIVLETDAKVIAEKVLGHEVEGDMQAWHSSEIRLNLPPHLTMSLQVTYSPTCRH
ncbi:hypothetical protein EJB05_56113, partial [Eragrostis curvula]